MLTFKNSFTECVDDCSRVNSVRG